MEAFDQNYITYTIEPGMAFESYAELDSTMEKYSRQESFYLTRNTANFPKERALDLFGKPTVNQRGRYFCNYKNQLDKSNRKKKSSCCFIVCYGYDLKTRKYVVRKSPFVLRHDHEIEDRSSELNPPRIVSLERDLTKEEYEDIIRYSPYYGVAQVRELLRPKYQHREYAASLMSRLLKKGKQLFYEKAFKHHPLYDPSERVLRMQGDEDSRVLQEKIGRTSMFTALAPSLISYNQVSFPSCDLTRYWKLRERADRLILQAVNNEHLYKLLTLTLKDIQTQFDEKAVDFNGTDSEFDQPDDALAMDVSQVLGKRSHEEERDACEDCKQHGLIVFDHQAKSDKCPYVQIAEI